MIRRTIAKGVVSVIGLLWMPGCSTVWDEKNKYSGDRVINIINYTTSTASIKMEMIKDSQGGKVYEKSIEVAPEEPETYSIELQPGTYRLVASESGGLKNSFRWEIVEGDESGVDVEIHSDQIEFSIWEP